MLNKPGNILLIYSLPYTLAILLSEKGEKAILWVVESILLIHLIGCLFAIGIYLRGDKSSLKGLASFYRRKQIDFLMILISLVICISVVAVSVVCESSAHVLWQSSAALLMNIAGAFVALILTFYFLRPKLHIYPTLALFKKDGIDNYGKILVKNTNRADLYDVHIRLEFCTKENGITNIDNFVIEDAQIPILKGTLSNGDSSRAWRTKEPIPNVYLESEEDYIRCRVEATYSISGTRFVKEHVFYMKDYQHGDYDGNNNFIAI